MYTSNTGGKTLNRSKRASVCTLLAMFSLGFACVCFSLAAQAADGAPVAENMELTTYRNVSVGGRLQAVDPEGDVVLFELTTPPMKGSLDLDSDGRFVYSPGEDKKGRDYFGFRAVDALGNTSQEATVIIKIMKQKSSVSYDDLDGSATERDAVRLAENGVFTGIGIGASLLFEPGEPVTRGEFLAMCMKLTGAQVLTGVSATGFTDDQSMPAWLKPYVATALMDGYVTGRTGAFGPTFDGCELITCSEATVMLDNVLALSDSSVFDSAAPVWAAQAAANLSACDMLPYGCGYGETLTRADAAAMLSAALDVLDKR